MSLLPAAMDASSLDAARTLTERRYCVVFVSPEDLQCITPVLIDGQLQQLHLLYTSEHLGINLKSIDNVRLSFVEKKLLSSNNMHGISLLNLN